MSKAANADTAVNLSSKYYMRNFYVSNRTVMQGSQRENYSPNQLSYEDASALRRAVKKLGSFEYNSDSSTNVRNSVKAYINTYNNLLSSVEDAQESDVTEGIERLKSLTGKYKDQLDKIGITVNNDGTLKTRDILFANADISKFEELFSGKSDFMQKSSSYAKQIQHYAKQLCSSDKQKAARPKEKSESLEALLNTGVGNTVDLTL